jgi:hypothetical protein
LSDSHGCSQVTPNIGITSTRVIDRSAGTHGAIYVVAMSGSKAVLHAYDATDLAHEIYNSSQAANNRDQFGAGNKFITPTIADGKVFVGTQNSVAVFGLLQ